MKQIKKDISIKTQPKSLNDITHNVIENLLSSNIKNGLCTLFIKHTSASLIIQENADPAVLRDIENFFKKLVPEDERLYEHDCEGPDDMPSHVKASMLGSDVTIPITSGQPNFGTWQGIILGEHRIRAGSRRIIATLMYD